MKSIFLLLALIIGLGTASAQVNALKMNHPDSRIEKVIKENRRVVVKTKTGQKVKGRLVFVDDETISLKGQEILIADIIKIKHNPLLLSILIDGLMFYTAGSVLAFGVLITAFSSSGGTAAYFIIPAAALIYGGIASPKFTKGYKTYTGWSYEMVTVPDNK